MILSVSYALAFILISPTKSTRLLFYYLMDDGCFLNIFLLHSIDFNFIDFRRKRNDLAPYFRFSTICTYK